MMWQSIFQTVFPVGSELQEEGFVKIKRRYSNRQFIVCLTSLPLKDYCIWATFFPLKCVNLQQKESSVWKLGV